MIHLPNSCYCSEPCVHPKNWQSKKASTEFPWYISYRFYDPTIKQPNGLLKPRQIIIKGMNIHKGLLERQMSVESLIQYELDLLQNQGLNKITGVYAPEVIYDISEYDYIVAGLDWAFGQLEVGKQTMTNVKYALKHVKRVVNLLQFDRIQLKDVKTKHIRFILNKCVETKSLSAQSFNHYRSYLQMLFKILLQIDAVDYNPVERIEKKSILKRVKKLLTIEERKRINDYWLKTDKYFWRFMHCFFHSGARGIELLELKKEDVDLDKLTYKITVKKGKLFEEQLRPIKYIAVQFWEQQMEEARAGDYIFGSELEPGKKKGTRDYITKTWMRHIKRKLGIDVNFYLLKHQNLDETAALLNANYASKMAGHTSPVITLKHYLVNEKERENELLRQLNNPFC